MNVEYLVLGLGKSGFSCIKYLRKYAKKVAVADTRQHPPYEQQLKKVAPEIKLYQLDLNKLQYVIRDFPHIKYLVASPGIQLPSALIKEAQKRGIKIINDIELFAIHKPQAPVIGITGSNGKTTVTDMLGFIAGKLGINVAVGGNIGTPALDLLDDAIELYILELSSFQLEYINSLDLEVATILNITPDHLDRYKDFTDYVSAKQRIFSLSKVVVFNSDDSLVSSLVPSKCSLLAYSLKNNDQNTFSLSYCSDKEYITFGNKHLMSIEDLPLTGRHQLLNILTALNMGLHLGWPIPQMLEYVQQYRGLPHRCQLVTTCKGVRYINDSKATNVGAAMAAIDSIGHNLNGKIVLILGGQTKGGDLSELYPVIQQYVSHILLIGVDALLIEQQLSKCNIKISHAKSLEDAVDQANTLANFGDVVLLSPACASFDMFANYEDRGEVFSKKVCSLSK